jgi:Trk K+ transport system NAD-binding subunit
MILVVRPASVFVAMWRGTNTLAERSFLAFLAPRGIVAAAVSSVFALKLGVSAALHGNSPELLVQAERMVPVTFLVILSTVAFYGLSAGALARWLGLADPSPQGILFAGADPWVRSVASMLKDAGFQVVLVDTNYSHCAQAQMDGLPAECASVLSEYVQEEMDLSGIGRLLAVTPNGEVNALAAREMAHVFGRRNVYQITPDDEASGRRRSVGEHLRGRQLFRQGLTSETLSQMLGEGAVFKKTALTDKFTYQDFQDQHGASVVVMFIINRRRELQICVPGDPLKLEPGDTLLALVPADD